MRHDTGNKLGFLKALVYFALRRPDLAGPFREYSRSLDLKWAPAATSFVLARWPRVMAPRSWRLVGLGGASVFVPASVLVSDNRPPCLGGRVRLRVFGLLAGRLVGRSLVALGVVGDVETRALELNRGSRLEAPHRALLAECAHSTAGSENFRITSNRRPHASHSYW